MQLIKYIFARLAEVSTWRGVILIFTALGIHFSPGQAQAIISAGLAIVGVIHVFTKQKND